MLLKLHGSINWYRYKDGRSRDIAAKVTGPDRDHLKTSDGADLGVSQERILLAVTTNKELAYGSGVFLELMYQLHRLLKDTNLLIVSGYGFGDKGINNRIWYWLDSRDDTKMVVLHKEKDVLMKDARASLTIQSQRLKSRSKLIFVDKWMCDCSVADVEAVLNT